MTEATANQHRGRTSNPTLDRIRNMLKNIPKSGNPDETLK